MRIIGLTGGTGSGKGFVSSMLKKRSAYVMDTDMIAHEIIEKVSLHIKSLLIISEKVYLIKTEK